MRQAFNVLVIPYRQVNNILEYAVFKRSDGPIYQGLSGGVEEDESLLEAAKRESYEEMGIDIKEFIELEASASIPAHFFKEYKLWNTLIVKEFAFGAQIEEVLFLSEEHESYQWLSYEEAYKLFTYDSNRVALWELNERIKYE